MATVGNVGEFDCKSEDWDSYIERVENFFEANSIADDKKVQVLLTLIGRDTYGLIRNLCSPDKPATKSLKNIVELVKNHLSPAPNITAERYRFNKRSQRENESISEYVAALRQLSINCNFADTLNDRLKDKFIHGLKNELILKRLLSEEKLNFTETVKLATALEIAQKDVLELKGKEDVSINKLHVTDPQAGSKNSNQNKRKFKPCFRCGKTNHHHSNCFAIKGVCKNCKKVGHFMNVCKSKSNKNIQPLTGKDPQAERSAHALDLNELEEVPFLKLGRSGGKPIMLNVKLNGKAFSMELDSGSAITVISENVYSHHFKNIPLKPNDIILKPYKGERIFPMGWFKIDIEYNGQVQPLAIYVVDGDGPLLLGRDWLEIFKVNWGEVHLLRNIPKLTLDSVLEKHSELFKDNKFGKIKDYKAHLDIQDGAQPRHFKARPIPYHIQPMVKKELERLQAHQIIEPIQLSDWASPIVPIIKKDGGIRICGDFKVSINSYLKRDPYPLPKIEDIFAALNGGQKFTKIDLVGAYHQIELDEESQKLVVINTPWGLYKILRMPFGITPASSIFQRTIDAIIKGLPRVCGFQDDLLVTGVDDEDHLSNLDALLTRLREAGIQLKRSKCEFMKNSIEYLGHVIDAQGLRTVSKKLQAIVDAPKPKDVSQLKSFLGALNYYGKFIPQLSTILGPLHSLLKKGAKWKWNTSCQKAFEKAKNRLINSGVLIHFNPEKQIELFCDASAYGVGATITHKIAGEHRPIMFASKTLNSAQRNYSQIHKEALAIVFGIKRFHQYLFGKKFIIWTDHKPLITLFDPKKEIPGTMNPRMQRWILLLSGYDYEIRYLSSSDNVVADMLSRLPMKNTEDPIKETDEVQCLSIKTMENISLSFQDVARHTRTDKVLAQVSRMIQNGWPESIKIEELKPYFCRRNELTVELGCIMWGLRVVIPASLRQTVLEYLHEGHFGVVKMKALARSYVWWPKLDSQIEETVANCKWCQQLRNVEPKASLHPWEFPKRAWSRVHADFAGPFMGCMFLVIIDAYSKWPEIFQMNSTTSESTIAVFRDLFIRYGLPDVLVTDNGPQFRSEEFKSYTESNGVIHKFSAPNHPATNGAAENTVKTFKNSIKASVNAGLNVRDALQRFLMNYRVTPHSTTGETPAKLLFGRNLRTRFDLIRPNLQSVVLNKQQKQTFYYGGTNKNFNKGDYVWARDYRHKDKWMNGKILRVLGPRNVEIEMNNGLTWKRHVDQLRHAAESHATDKSLVQYPDIVFPNSSTTVPIAKENYQPNNDIQSTVQSVPRVSEESSTSDSGRCHDQMIIPPDPGISDGVLKSETVRRSQRLRKPPQRLNL